MNHVAWLRSESTRPSHTATCRTRLAAIAADLEAIASEIAEDIGALARENAEDVAALARESVDDLEALLMLTASDGLPEEFARAFRAAWGLTPRGSAPPCDR